MKISEMIKNLQEFMDEHGDIECWHILHDGEHDNYLYSEVVNTPELYCFTKDRVCKMVDIKLVDELEKESKGILKPVCIVVA